MNFNAGFCCTCKYKNNRFHFLFWSHLFVARLTPPTPFSNSSNIFKLSIYVIHIVFSYFLSWWCNEAKDCIHEPCAYTDTYYLNLSTYRLVTWVSDVIRATHDVITIPRDTIKKSTCTDVITVPHDITYWLLANNRATKAGVSNRGDCSINRLTNNRGNNNR